MCGRRSAHDAAPPMQLVSAGSPARTGYRQVTRAPVGEAGAATLASPALAASGGSRPLGGGGGGGCCDGGHESQQLGSQPIRPRLALACLSSPSGKARWCAHSAIPHPEMARAKTRCPASPPRPAGLFDQDVLFTDLLVQGYDAGNTAGYAVLALALMIALASPEAWNSAAVLATEEIDACLLDYEADGPICGKGANPPATACVRRARLRVWPSHPPSPPVSNSYLRGRLDMYRAVHGWPDALGVRLRRGETSSSSQRAC